MSIFGSVCYFVIIFAGNLVNRTLASDIECIPIDQCPFAYRVVNRTGTKNAPFFFDSVCGYDEKVNVKIWCNKFLECTTPENEKGTCISLKYCSHFLNLLYNINNITNLHTKNLLRSFRCNKNTEKEVYVCCPHTSERKAYTVNNIKYSDKVTDLTIKNENDKNSNKNLELTTARSKSTKRNKRHFLNSSWNWKDAELLETKSNFPFSENRHIPKPKGSYGEYYYPHHENIFHHFYNKNKITEKIEYDNSKFKQNDSLENNYHKTHFDEWNKHKHFPEVNKDSETGFSRLENTCSTPDGRIGICIPVSRCKSLLKNRNYEAYYDGLDEQVLKKLKCNTTHIFILHICCPIKESNFINDTSPPQNSEFENSTNKNIVFPNKPNDVFKPFENICGTQEISEDKILGGFTTDLGEFPWLALLQYSGISNLVFACAGSLITDRFVVTAAHCVDLNLLRQKSLKLLSVSLGEYDIRNETDCLYMKYGTNCADPAKFYSVEKTISHNLYKSGESLANDIALVKVQRAVKFTEFIRPICLPDKADILKEDQKVVISGWGKTKTEQMSPVKRKATIQLTSNNQCNNYLEDSVMVSGQICLTGGNGTDSCNGDSGGSVMLEEQNKSGKFVFILVGIISFGFRPCGQFPSVATNVSRYFNWIEDNVRQNL